MSVFKAAPSSPTFDTRNPAGRELIVAADLSAARETSRTEVECYSRRVLAEDAAEMAADVTAGPVIWRDGRCWGSRVGIGGQIRR